MTDDNKARLADNLENELASLPDKFKGKSVVDVARAYTELETAYSRQGQELGESRRLSLALADTTSRPPVEKAEERPSVTTDDLFADPAKAIDDVIESHPIVKKARETTENLERQLAHKDFESRHPSYREDVKDQEFVRWVQSNVSLTKLAARADAYDFDSADQLLGLWEEKKSIKQTVERSTKDLMDKKDKERAGTLEGASGADASSDVVLNRAEIRELHRRALLGDKQAKAKWEDPKFRAMRLKAYASGRVS